MRLTLVASVIVSGLLAGCAGGPSIKPSEVLDERTGMTVGALETPIEFVQAGGNALPATGKSTSFAYLGPLEWDKSGDSSYGLWLHVAPGNDRQVADIHVPGAVTLMLDDGPLVLTSIDSAGVGSGPYRAVASWGQTGYFSADVESLKRLAGSDKLVLYLHGTDGFDVSFTPTHETRATLTQFNRARGITGD